MHRAEEIGLRDAGLLDFPQNGFGIGKRAAFVHYLFVRVRRLALHFGQHVDAVAALCRLVGIGRQIRGEQRHKRYGDERARDG